MNGISRSCITALLCLPLAATAANIDKDIPLGNFSEQDMKIFRQTVDDTLEKGADGAGVAWSNPETKSHGEVKPLKSFERAGSRCRTANIANNAKGRAASGPFTFCRAADGKWVLSDPPKPAK